MSKYTGSTGVVASVPPVADDVTPQHELGTKVVTPDGRAYRYVGCGGTALVTGNLIQSEAEDTGEQNLAVDAAAIGATTVTTSTTVTVVANEYAGGQMLVSVTPGLGTIYRIKRHPAATAATVVLTLEDPIQVALTTDSRVDLVPNIYDNVIQSPATASGVTLGVAVNNITADQYGWIQVGGIANCLADGTVTVGTHVVKSDATAGAVEAFTGVLASVGTAVTGIASTESGAILLHIE